MRSFLEVLQGLLEPVELSDSQGWYAAGGRGRHGSWARQHLPKQWGGGGGSSTEEWGRWRMYRVEEELTLVVSISQGCSRIPKRTRWSQGVRCCEHFECRVEGKRGGPCWAWLFSPLCRE